MATLIAIVLGAAAAAVVYLQRQTKDEADREHRVDERAATIKRESEK